MNEPTAEGAPASWLEDLIEMAQEHADQFHAAYAGYKPARHAFYDSVLAQARAALASVHAPAWREAVEFACHQLEKQRVWAGMQWHYNPIPPFQYKPALENLRALLKANPVAPAPSADSEEKR